MPELKARIEKFLEENTKRMEWYHHIIKLLDVSADHHWGCLFMCFYCLLGERVRLEGSASLREDAHLYILDNVLRHSVSVAAWYLLCSVIHSHRQPSYTLSKTHQGSALCRPPGPSSIGATSFWHGWCSHYSRSTRTPASSPSRRRCPNPSRTTSSYMGSSQPLD